MSARERHNSESDVVVELGMPTSGVPLPEGARVWGRLAGSRV
jgi:hypothetical protein